MNSKAMITNVPLVPDPTILDLMKQDMVQSVVHDLRTPMTVIKGYLLMLLSGMMGNLSADQQQMIKLSVGPLEDMILMTENLLQSINLQKGDFQLKFSEVDLDVLLSDTIAFYQLPFQQRLMTIKREGNSLGIKTLLDSFWVKRVLNNLIWNAYKFTPDGGKVSIHVSHVDRGVQIAIKDTGRGIPKSKLDDIFEKYNQAIPLQDGKAGSGLGLWICKRVMELHGGSIHATSVEDKGTTFTLHFPSEPIVG